MNMQRDKEQIGNTQSDSFCQHWSRCEHHMRERDNRSMRKTTLFSRLCSLDLARHRVRCSGVMVRCATFFAVAALVCVPTRSVFAQQANPNMPATISIGLTPHAYPMWRANPQRTGLVDDIGSSPRLLWSDHLQPMIPNGAVSDEYDRIVVLTQFTKMRQLAADPTAHDKAQYMTQWERHPSTQLRHVAGPVILSDATRVQLTAFSHDDDTAQVGGTVDHGSVLSGFDSLGNEQFRVSLGTTYMEQMEVLLPRKDGTLVVANQNELVVVSSNGVILSRVPLSVQPPATLLEDAEGVLVANGNGAVFRKLPKELTFAPQIIGKFVDGIVGTAVVHRAGVLLAITRGNLLVSMDLSTGLTETIEFGAKAGSSPVVGADGTVHLLSRTGQLISLTPSGSIRSQTNPLRFQVFRRVSVAETGTYHGPMDQEHPDTAQPHRPWQSDTMRSETTSSEQTKEPFDASAIAQATTRDSADSEEQNNDKKNNEERNTQANQTADQAGSPVKFDARATTPMLVDRLGRVLLARSDGVIVLVGTDGSVRKIPSKAQCTPVGLTPLSSQRFVLACYGGRIDLYGP